MTLIWTYNDGGRQRAGFTGKAGDCTCRAIAIASDTPYQVVYDRLNELAKLERQGRRSPRGRSSARTGVKKSTIKRYMLRYHPDVAWTPTMGIGTGCTVHLRADQLPRAALLVVCSVHTTTMMYGVIHDTYDPSRDGTRCVYGYWTFPDLELLKR